jgi:hypothetical protein
MPWREPAALSPQDMVLRRRQKRAAMGSLRIRNTQRGKMTKIAKSISLSFCFALLCLAISPSVKGDEWDKKAILTFSGPVQVQNTRLNAGTYVFKLADTTDRRIVQIFNQDETQVIAIIMAIPD